MACSSSLVWLIDNQDQVGFFFIVIIMKLPEFYRSDSQEPMTDRRNIIRKGSWEDRTYSTALTFLGINISFQDENTALLKIVVLCSVVSHDQNICTFIFIILYDNQMISNQIIKYSTFITNNHNNIY